MQTSKSFIAVSIAAILAYFEPIRNLLTAISLVFVLNFIFGLVAGIIANKEAFNFKKAFACVTEASVFLFLLSAVFFIADHLNLTGGGPGTTEQLVRTANNMQAISTITYVLLYFYTINILKNLRQLLPSSKAIAYLYNLLSIELISRMPGLKQLFTKMDAENNVKTQVNNENPAR